MLNAIILSALDNNVISEENKLLFPYPPHLNTTLPCKMHNFFICCFPPKVGGSEKNFKKAGCGLALVALKRTSCDVWQLECQSSSVRANVQSDHLLHRYMLPVYFELPLTYCIVHHAVLKFGPCRSASTTRPHRGLVLNTHKK